MSEFSLSYSAADFSRAQQARLLGELDIVGCGNFSGPPISDLPEAQKLILNDGGRTYLVHSTTEVAAEKICADGLNVPELGGQPTPWKTTYMLEGPSNLSQEPANRCFVDYRYRSSGITSLANAKVVLSFPMPRPLGINSDGLIYPHAATDLVRPGSSFLRRGPNGRLFYPPEFVEGYFLHNEPEYVPNPFYKATAVNGLNRFMSRVGLTRRHRR